MSSLSAAHQHNPPNVPAFTQQQCSHNRTFAPVWSSHLKAQWQAVCAANWPAVPAQVSASYLLSLEYSIDIPWTRYTTRFRGSPIGFSGSGILAFLNVGIRDFSGKERRYSGLELGTGRGIWRFYQARCGKCYSKETRSGKSGVENVQWKSSCHRLGREKKFTGSMFLQIKFLQCSLTPCS